MLPQDERLLSIQEVADWIGVSAKTLYNWRTEGKGPRAYRIGQLVKYRASDVTTWLEDQREPSPGGSRS